MFLRVLLAIASLILSQKSFANDKLSGVWRQDCESRNFRQENFTSTHVAYSEKYFQDNNCLVPQLTLIAFGSYSTNGQTIDFRFIFAKAKVENKALVNAFNQRKVCGLTDWVLDHEKDVSGLSCDFFGFGKNFPSPKDGDMRYGIWKIEGRKLHLGQITREFNATEPNKRPIDWNPRAYIRID